MNRPTADDSRHPFAIHVNGPGGPTRHHGIVHFGPEPGFCSVDTDGCGYCIGVPCKSPAKPVPDDETEAIAAWQVEHAANEWDRGLA